MLEIIIICSRINLGKYANKLIRKAALIFKLRRPWNWHMVAEKEAYNIKGNIMKKKKTMRVKMIVKHKNNFLVGVDCIGRAEICYTTPGNGYDSLSLWINKDVFFKQSPGFWHWPEIEILSCHDISRIDCFQRYWFPF